jgi:hypothetical protein
METTAARMQEFISRIEVQFLTVDVLFEGSNKVGRFTVESKGKFLEIIWKCNPLNPIDPTH